LFTSTTQSKVFGTYSKVLVLLISELAIKVMLLCSSEMMKDIEDYLDDGAIFREIKEI